MNTEQKKNALQDGFSMVEMLVALVVLGVGMLGMASLYVTTLRASSSAISRMQAANLASDIADRIRANRNASAAYDTTVTAAANKSCAGTAAVICSPGDMAANDLFLWNQDINATLPGNPQGKITVSAGGTPRDYKIEISWSEPGEPAALSYTLRMQI